MLDPHAQHVTAPIRDPQDAAGLGKPAHAWGGPASAEATLRGAALSNNQVPLASGQHLFSGYCAS